LNTLSEQEAMDSLEAFKELDEIENELFSGDLGSG
jgi:hydrogenase maturation factor